MNNTELNPEKMESEAKDTIRKLTEAGKGREANSLGEVLGNWRKGRVGDSLMRAAIVTGNNDLAR